MVAFPTLGKAVRHTLVQTYRGHSAYFEEMVKKAKRTGEFRNTRAVAIAFY